MNAHQRRVLKRIKERKRIKLENTLKFIESRFYAGLADSARQYRKLISNELKMKEIEKQKEELEKELPINHEVKKQKKIKI